MLLEILFATAGLLASSSTVSCDEARTFVIFCQCKCDLILDKESTTPKLDIIKTPTTRIFCYRNLEEALRDRDVVCQDAAIIVDKGKFLLPDCTQVSNIQDKT